MAKLTARVEPAAPKSESKGDAGGASYSVGVFQNNQRQDVAIHKWLFQADGSFWIDGSKVGLWIDNTSGTKKVTALFGDKFEELLILQNGEELLATSGSELRYWGKH